MNITNEIPPHCTVAASPRPRVSASVLLVFIDGLGIGTRGDHNPLDGLESNLFAIFQGEEPHLPFDGRMAVTDARLGVDGLPQSATGQTAILTGVNAPALIGRHLNGYPSPRLKRVLAEHSIYKQLIERGCEVTFANAYTPRFFENRPRFISATTVAAESAGLRLRTIDDLIAGDAVYHDFTNKHANSLGYSVPARTSEEAGAQLSDLAARHQFTLYEHFVTDRIGHKQDRELARTHLGRLDRFVGAVLETADLDKQTVIITSDHGNIEDLTIRSHSMNPVATLAFGPAREYIASRVRRLTDITPAIVEFCVPESGNGSVSSYAPRAPSRSGS